MYVWMYEKLYLVTLTLSTKKLVSTSGVKQLERRVKEDIYKKKEKNKKKT